MNWITEYNSQIQSGEIQACDKLKRIYSKLSADCDREESRYIFSQEHAQRPIDFIETFCKHSKGEWAGKPLKLELFQKAFISALFGFIDRQTGFRKYTETFFMVARKNGKSELLSALALYLMIADGEAGAEIYSVATKKDQAKIVFDETVRMVQQSAALSAHVKKRKSDIFYPDNMSKFMALGKNADTLDGLNSHGIIIDEAHAIKDRNLYEVMKQSMSARRQPLLIMITTAGTLRECIFDDMYDYATELLEGKFEDEHFLPVIYELDRKEEYKDSTCWIKANPAIGTIKKIEDLKSKVERAKNNPADLAGVLVKDFDIRENARQCWLSLSEIENPAAFDMDDFRGVYAIGGADLSRTTDLTCGTYLFYDPESACYLVKQMYFIPEDALNNSDICFSVPYRKWIERGFVRVCPGNMIDYHMLTDWFVEMVEEYDVKPTWIYYDRYSAKYWVDEMKGKGFRMVDCAQGAKTLSIPMELLKSHLGTKKINYGNNPVLKWCLGNTGVIADRNGNMMPVKAVKQKYRIDGMASLLDAYVGLNEHMKEFMNLYEE